MSVWLCEKHYKESCLLEEHKELEVCPIPNIFWNKCVVCGVEAKHLTCISENILLILNGDKNDK